MGLATRHEASHPPVPAGRRIGRMECLNHVVYGKSDEDRHRKLRKRSHGTWRQCPVCGAQARRKRWTRVGRPMNRHPYVWMAHPIEQTLCEGCRRVREGRIDGVLELEGLNEPDLGELSHMIRNIAVEAWHDDPVHRIVTTHAKGSHLTIETTSIWLAQTLAKAIRRRFGGDLDIHWTPGSDFTRLYWQAPRRDASSRCKVCNGTGPARRRLRRRGHQNVT